MKINKPFLLLQCSKRGGGDKKRKKGNENQWTEFYLGQFELPAGNAAGRQIRPRKSRDAPLSFSLTKTQSARARNGRATSIHPFISAIVIIRQLRHDGLRAFRRKISFKKIKGRALNYKPLITAGIAQIIHSVRNDRLAGTKIANRTRDERRPREING